MRNDVGAQPVDQTIEESAELRLNQLSLARSLRTANTISAPSLKCSIIFAATDMSSCRVRIEGDRRIGLADLREETGQERVLMTDIA